MDVISKFRLAAVIVTFNPDSLLVDSVMELSKQVERIILVDNCSVSRVYVDAIADLKIEGVDFLLLDDNYGIGYALNRGAELAASSGYNWLLTLDQDTIVPSGYICEVVNLLSSQGNVFSVCAKYDVFNDTVPDFSYEKVLYSITSGHVVNIEKLISIGGYDEDLFIDGVDFDIFLKLNLHGFDTYLINSCFLKHRLGDESVEFPFLSRFHTYHSPLRRYYIYRNTIVLAKRYYKYFPIFVIKSVVASFIYLFTVLLLGKRRKESFKMILLGTLDGIKGKLGKKI